MKTDGKRLPKPENGDILDTIQAFSARSQPGAVMHEKFISEAIEPLVATSDTLRMAAGEPGLPAAFRWRGETLNVTAVLRSWRETGPCRHGSGERYVRKHWYEVATVAHGTLTIYFDRQPRRGRREGRWWLFSRRVAEPIQEDKTDDQ